MSNSIRSILTSAGKLSERFQLIQTYISYSEINGNVSSYDSENEDRHFNDDLNSIIEDVQFEDIEVDSSSFETEPASFPAVVTLSSQAKIHQFQEGLSNQFVSENTFTPMSSSSAASKAERETARKQYYDKYSQKFKAPKGRLIDCQL